MRWDRGTHGAPAEQPVAPAVAVTSQMLKINSDALLSYNYLSFSPKHNLIMMYHVNIAPEYIFFTVFGENSSTCVTVSSFHCKPVETEDLQIRSP